MSGRRKPRSPRAAKPTIKLTELANAASEVKLSQSRTLGKVSRLPAPAADVGRRLSAAPTRVAVSATPTTPMASLPEASRQACTTRLSGRLGASSPLSKRSNRANAPSATRP